MDPPKKKQKRSLDLGQLCRILGVCPTECPTPHTAFCKALYKDFEGRGVQGVLAAVQFSYDIVNTDKHNPVFGNVGQDKIVKYENTNYALGKHILDAICFFKNLK
jgi:hypothetical protein